MQEYVDVWYSSIDRNSNNSNSNEIIPDHVWFVPSCKVRL